MPKETFYFPHDYNARNDRKLVRVLMELGLSGIGAYWCVVEMLYEEGGYLNCSDIPMIAKELRMQVRTLENLIENFGLFEQTEEHFYSSSVLFRLSKRIARSDAARNSALSRWNSGANAMRTQCEGNAIKDKIVKDKIVKDIITPTPLPDWLDKEIWEAFLEMRKKIKKPLTPYAEQLAIKKLEKFRADGEDAQEILDRAIIGSWQGIYSLKDKRNGGQNGAHRENPIKLIPRSNYTRPEDA